MTKELIFDFEYVNETTLSDFMKNKNYYKNIIVDNVCNRPICDGVFIVVVKNFEDRHTDWFICQNYFIVNEIIKPYEKIYDVEVIVSWSNATEFVNMMIKYGGKYEYQCIIGEKPSHWYDDIIFNGLYSSKTKIMWCE